MNKRQFLRTLAVSPFAIGIADNSFANEEDLDLNSYYIDPQKYGMNSESSDNSAALKKAIDISAETGLPIAIRSSSLPYRILGDIVLKGTGGTIQGVGGRTHLMFEGGGLILSEPDSKNRGQILRDIMISRTGSFGPALLLKTTRSAKSTRFTWNNVHILSSSGDGVVFEGAYLGAISGLWVTRCEGTGIVFKPGNEKNSNAAGANSINFMGGEAQNCGWGVEATDTKGITFSGFAIEGNRLGGLWLRGDNRAFTLAGGYFENNAKGKGKGQEKGAKAKYHCDIRIGDPEWKGDQNRNISINNAFFSDGKIQHKNAVWIEDNQKNIIFNLPYFWAYGDSPIQFANTVNNNSSGQVYAGENSRADGKSSPIIKHDLKFW